MGSPEVTYTARVSIINCSECQAPIALTNESQLRDNHKSFMCPNGHDQAFLGGSKAEREATEAKAALAKEIQRREIAEREAAMEKNLRVKADKEYTRKMKRVANGVCVCCNRTFQNLARHMKTKHPNEVAKQK